MREGGREGERRKKGGRGGVREKERERERNIQDPLFCLWFLTQFLCVDVG